MPIGNTTSKEYAHNFTTDYFSFLVMIRIYRFQDFKQGDEVYGQASVFSGGSGAFAELALTNPDSIAHKPKTLNHLEAAALPRVTDIL